MRTGIYKKFSTIDNISNVDNTTICYIANSKTEDITHRIGNILKNNVVSSINTNTSLEKHFDMNFYDNDLQEDIKTINNYYPTVLFIKYDVWGNSVLDVKKIYFDFNNSTIQIDKNKSLKVTEDKSKRYTYRLFKKNISCKNGIKGFYKFILDSLNINSPFHYQTYKLLKVIENRA